MPGKSRFISDHWLTRAQVADRLGISVSSVRRMEWAQLHPEVDDRGVHRFDPQEIAHVHPRQRAPARKRSPEERARAERGRLAVRVFLMFERSMTLPEIVFATRQPPEVIRNLYREWTTGLSDA